MNGPNLRLTSSFDCLFFVFSVCLPGRMFGRKQNVLCARSSMAGLLSVIVILMTLQTPLLNPLKSEYSRWSGELQHTCMYGSMYV